jgi:hypothetical protein
VGYFNALAMEILIVEPCFCAEDYCDGVVISLCSGIKICGFLHGDAVLRLSSLAYFPLILILVELLDACAPLDPQVLVVW